MDVTKRKRSLQVVLTREEKASVDLSIKLRELRFKPIIFPTVQFARVYSDYTGPQNFSGTDWLLFPTKRAVEYFFKRFKQRVDGSVKFCVIGSSTREELLKNNYEDSLLLSNGSQKTILNNFENIDPCKIVYICSKSTSGNLDKVLKDKGFIVKDLPLYTTEPPAEIDQTKLEIIKNGYYDIMTFASSSSIKHLMIILKGKVGVFKNKTALVISKDLKKYLEGGSFKNILCAKTSDEQGLIDALIEYRDNLSNL